MGKQTKASENKLSPIISWCMEGSTTSEKLFVEGFYVATIQMAFW